MVIETNENLASDRIQNRVNLQARQIEQVFDQHGYPAQVTRGSAQPNSLQYQLKPVLTEGWRRLHARSHALIEDIKGTLRVPSVRLERSAEGQLQLQIIRPFDPPVPLQELLHLVTEIQPGSALLGLDENGYAAIHDFSSHDTPNMLIIGGERSGKTNLLRSMAASLAITQRQSQIQIIFINPIIANQEKQREALELLKPLDLLPHMITDHVSRTQDMIDSLSFLQGEIRYRRNQQFRLPRIILMVDEAETVLERGGDQISAAIHQIAEQGPDFGIHLVMATSRPEAGVFSPHLVTNLQAKIVGHFQHQEPASPYLGTKAEESTYLLGEGDFLLVKDKSSVRFQAAYIDNYDLHLNLTALYRSQPTLLANPYQGRIGLKPNAVIEKPAEKKELDFIDELMGVN